MVTSCVSSPNNVWLNWQILIKFDTKVRSIVWDDGIVTITNTILDIIHRSIIYNNLSETGFCLRLQVEPTQLGPIYETSLWVRKEGLAPSIGPIWEGST
jgi:hypothetical protein